jgi:hypothetical protein
VAESLQHVLHRCRAAGGGIGHDQVPEHLGRDAVGRLDLLADRGAGVPDLVGEQHGHKYGRDAGQDQIQAGAQLHRGGSGTLKKIMRSLS